MSGQSSAASTVDPVLDRTVNGGVPRERAVLAPGEPGTGESTLAIPCVEGATGPEHDAGGE